MGKLTISIAIFNSYVKLPEGKYILLVGSFNHLEKYESVGMITFPRAMFQTTNQILVISIVHRYPIISP